MRPIFTLFLVFILSSFPGESQITFRQGFDLGITAAQAPYIKSNKNDKYTYREYYYPLLGFTIGYRPQLEIGKHFRIISGVNYNIVGTRLRVKSKGYQTFYDQSTNTIEDTYYESNGVRKQTFHRVSIPIIFGFNYHIGEKINQTIGIGYKANYFISGKYMTRTNYESEKESMYPIYEYEIKNVTDPDHYHPVQRFNNQVTIQLTTLFKERYQIGIDYNIGSRIYYSEHYYWEYSSGNYINQDVGLTFTYFIP